MAGCTTQEQVYKDNANRSFLIYIDESRGQDERIMAYQRSKSAGRIDKVAENKTTQLLQNTQRVLQPRIKDKAKTMNLYDKMKPFPYLKHNQVALVRAEKKTGHVLDEKLALALSDNQKVYTVFDSLDEAQTFTERILSSNQEIEVAIYSDLQEVLFYSNP